MADSVQASGTDSEMQQHLHQMLKEYGDEDFCLSLVKVFIRDGTKVVEQLRSSVESGETVNTHSAAHSLKNMLGILRSSRGMALADRVCAELNAGSPSTITSGSAESPIQELLSLTTRLIEECRAFIKTPKAD